MVSIGIFPERIRGGMAKGGGYHPHLTEQDELQILADHAAGNSIRQISHSHCRSETIIRRIIKRGRPRTADELSTRAKPDPTPDEIEARKIIFFIRHLEKLLSMKNSEQIRIEDREKILADCFIDDVSYFNTDDEIEKNEK
jgi:IS30 family transposase